MLTSAHIVIAGLTVIAVANLLTFSDRETRIPGNWDAIRGWEGEPLYQSNLSRQRNACYFSIGQAAPGAAIVAPLKKDSWDLTQRERTITSLYGIGRARGFERREYDPRQALPADRYEQYVVRDVELYYGPRVGMSPEEVRRRLRRCKIALKDDNPQTLYYMTPEKGEIWYLDERLLPSAGMEGGGA